MNKYQFKFEQTGEILEFTRPYLSRREMKWATQMIHDYFDRSLGSNARILILRNGERYGCVIACCVEAGIVTMCAPTIIEYKNLTYSYLSTGHYVVHPTTSEEVWR